MVDVAKDIDMAQLKAGLRVALKNDSYTLHSILPSLVDPLVSLMKVRVKSETSRGKTKARGDRPFRLIFDTHYDRADLGTFWFFFLLFPRPPPSPTFSSNLPSN